MLFPLETSIPTAFILFLLLIGYGFPLFPHCLFNLLSDASAQGGSTCANRMLRMREAADGLLDGLDLNAEQLDMLLLLRQKTDQMLLERKAERQKDKP